ncbi:MAG: hypothetical protein JXA16_11700 [Bacteroidales bacterium]|nr:hypothetical protein [Bacteroidales bacterium]
MINNNINAQEVSAKLDTFQIEIGDQVYLYLSVSQDDNEIVKFPDLKDNIIDGVEIISKSTIDTNKLANGKLNLKQSLLITSFEDSLYFIPPFPFISGKDTLYTNSLSFDVLMMRIDSATVSKIDTNQILRIFDVKEPIKTPFTFEEFLKNYYLYMIGILALALITFLIWYYIKKKRENKPLIEIKKPQEPAHIIALRKLGNLKEKKLWQSGKEKAYYSELTDIIREYIKNRFNIHTFEKTSYQLLENIKISKIVDNERYNELSNLLNLSDLAKFAKYKPLPDENDLSMKNAIIFIKETLVEKKEVKNDDENSNVIENIENNIQN